jgi:hypothetical protein
MPDGSLPGDAVVKTFLEKALVNFREVTKITMRGKTALVTVEMRFLNNALMPHLAGMRRLIKNRFDYGLTVEAVQDDQQHWNPQFDRDTPVGGRVPTVADKPE